MQIGLIQQSTQPSIERPVMIVFAADHGIAHEGVSPFPQAVTAQMVANFLAGGAAINALSGVAGWTLEVVNAGVATPLPASPGLVDIPVGPGTRNFAREPAMTRDEALIALKAGARRRPASCVARDQRDRFRRNGHCEYLCRRVSDEPAFAAYRSTRASAVAQGSMTPGWRESARYWRRRWHFMAITTCGPANRWTYSMCSRRSAVSKSR